MYFHFTLTNHLSEYPLFEDDEEDVLDVLFFLLLFAFAMDISYIPPTAAPNIVFPFDSNTGIGGAKANPVTAVFSISFNAAFTLSLAEPSTENNAAPPEITALIHSSDWIAVTVVIQVLVIQCCFAHAQH